METATIDTAWAFRRYQELRPRLPKARRSGEARRFPDLAAVAGDFDVIMLDAYGVLNVGESPIPGAAQAIAAMRAAGKRVMVVSNSAGYPKPVMVARFRRLGFDFTDAEVTSSRESLQVALSGRDASGWAMMLGDGHGLSDFGAPPPALLRDGPAPYDAAQGFLLVGSDGWTAARQARLEAALREKPRPVLVGNPDLVAPRESGLSLEPGHYGHQIADRLALVPRFFGKPFPEIFDLALSRLPAAPDPARVLMVGDTLHTDILGGQHMGFATALVTDHGALSGLVTEDAIRLSGISPDFVLSSI